MMLSRWIQDAGHGGYDPGAVHLGQEEKVWNLEAATYVNDRLNEMGISSTLTRHQDTSLSNSERTNIVKQYDKCISHHFNAGGGRGAEFIHSIYADGKFESLLKEEFTKAGYPYRRTFTRTYPNRNHLDYYFMHRETGQCRVTIVEYDFLDGPNRKQLNNEQYRLGMYECVVQAILRDEGVQEKKEEKDDDLIREQMHRVVSGSFRNRELAENRKEQLAKNHFDSFIMPIEINEHQFYRVVVGSFIKKENADKRVAQLKRAGFDAFIALN